MREKQLAQEAKKLDAKVGGTRAALKETGEGLGGGGANREEVEKEPTDHPEGLRPKGWRRDLWRWGWGSWAGWGQAAVQSRAVLDCILGWEPSRGRLVTSPFP